MERLIHIDTQSRADAETARLQRIRQAEGKQATLLQEIIEGTPAPDSTFAEFDEIGFQLLRIRRESIGERKLVILSRFVVNLPPKRYN